MANDRIFYATQAVGMRKYTDTAQYATMHGVQSVGMTTNFNITPVFQYGEIAIYENIEDIPDVQISASKLLDGYPLFYHAASSGATSPHLAGRSNERSDFAMSIFADTDTFSAGAPGSQVTCSGLYFGSLSYTFDSEGQGTEDISFVGNDKVWANDPEYGDSTGAQFSNFSGIFDGTDSPSGVAGVTRREDILFAVVTGSGLDLNGMVADPDATILPPDIHGISTTGTNNLAAGKYPAHVNSISFSLDFGRESINELGHKAPYTRYASFPIEVTTEINVTSASGDMVSATEAGILTTGTGCGSDLGNLADATIRLATCNGLRIYAGYKNRLQTVSHAGGDTGGGNVTTSYTYRNFNDFTVLHLNDPNPSGAGWWSAKADYIVNV